MSGRNKKALVIISLVVLAIITIFAVFVLSKSDEKADPKNDKAQKSSSSTTTTNKKSTTTKPGQESTTTSLVLEGISISISTPVPNQIFSNQTVVVRTIIEGASSGTCELKFSRQGSKSIELEAPIIAAPTYFTCQGFDIEPSTFTDKGEWDLELKVSATNGKSGSETRKITVS